MCERIDQLLITQIAAAPVAVGNAADGRVLRSVMARAFSAPRAVSYEDISGRLPPRRFKNASNSQFITPTRRFTHRRSPCPAAGCVEHQLASLISLMCCLAPLKPPPKLLLLQHVHSCSFFCNMFCGRASRRHLNQAKSRRAL